MFNDISLSQRHDKDDDLAAFMPAPINIENIIIIKYDEAVPKPEIGPEENENEGKLVGLGGERVINDIIGKILTFFDSIEMFFRFFTLDKSFFNYVMFYNPKCAKNILFKYSHHPDYPIPYVTRLQINNKFRNIDHQMNVNMSFFPNLTHLYVNCHLLTVSNYQEVFQKVKFIELDFNRNQIFMDHGEFLEVVSKVQEDGNVFKWKEFFEPKDATNETRIEQRKKFMKEMKYEVWKYLKSFRTLRIGRYPVLGVARVVNSLSSQPHPFSNLALPFYPDGRTESNNPLPEFCDGFWRNVEGLELRSVNITNLQFEMISKTIRKLHLYDCNSMTYPAPRRGAPPINKEEDYRDDDDEAVGDLNYWLSQCVNLEDVTIHLNTQERLKFRDEAFRGLTRLKRADLSIQSPCEFSGSALPDSSSTLRWIRLNCETFNGVCAFKGLTKLRYLECLKGVGDFDGLDLVELRTLKLSSCKITDQVLSRMVQLRRVELVDCTRILGPGFQKLSNIRHLEITRGGKHISDQIFPYLVNCEVIKLSYCPSIGKEFKSITEKKFEEHGVGLPKLRVLELNNMSSFVGDFFTYTPNLVTLKYEFCPRVEMKENFLGLKVLKELTIVKSKMEFQILKKMQQLEIVELKPWTNHYLFRALKDELKNVKKFNVAY